MERRRAIAWAGSIALMGGVTALVAGSTLGGFGLGISRTPRIETISPGSKPQTTQVVPIPGSLGAPPVPGSPAPDPEPARGGSVPLATTSTVLRPVPDPARNITDYPREPAAHQKSPKIIVVSPLAATGSPDVSVPPRMVGRPDISAEKKKVPAPTIDKRSNRDGSITERRKWATRLARIRAILEHIHGFKAGLAEPPKERDVPSSGRVRTAEPKGGAANHLPRSRNHGRDG